MTSTAEFAGPLEAGHEALHRGDWSSAAQAFDAALQQAESPDALDGLGQARWWLNDLGLAIELREWWPVDSPPNPDWQPVRPDVTRIG